MSAERGQNTDDTAWKLSVQCKLHCKTPTEEVTTMSGYIDSPAGR